MRRAPKAAARALALAAMLAVSGIAASAASASGGQPRALPGVQLAYTCRSAPGQQLAVAQIAASFPAAGRVGQPTGPGTAGITVTIPHAAVARLVNRHVRVVAGTARLTVGVTQGGQTAAAAWPALAARTARLPARDSLTLKASGAVPSITPAAPGNLTVAAAGLLVDIQPRAAGGTTLQGRPALRNSPNMPPAVRLACTLSPGQGAVLATVHVTGTVPRRHALTAVDKKFCPPQPPGGLKLNPRFPPPKPPKGSTVINTPPEPGCAFAEGYSDVRKLNGSALVGPALSAVQQYVHLIANPAKNYLQADSALQLDYHGKHEFPPATATFLSFGFVPTTATLILKEIGTIDAYAVGTYQACTTCQQLTKVYTRVFIHIENVSANGTPLPVGSDCGTPAFDIVLTGKSLSKPPYSLNLGGPLTSSITIPQFTGCGVDGDNLNLVLDAAISGKGNFSIITQGGLCTTLKPPVGCPPKPPKKLVRKIEG